MSSFKVLLRAGASGSSRRRKRLLSAATAAASAASVFAASGLFAAQAQAVPPNCSLRSLPSFVDQGSGSQEASVADIVEVGCEPAYAGDTIDVHAAQLYSACGGHLSWSLPYPYAKKTGSSVSVKLSAAGNATVALWGGPNCKPGVTLINAEMEQAPYETVTTSYTVLPEQDTPLGVYALPNSQTEDKPNRSVAAIVEVGFSSADAGEYVRIGAEQLHNRCLLAPRLRWFGPDATEPTGDGDEVWEVRLDAHGNAFVVLLGGPSCVEGTSLIEGELEQDPFTTYTADFTITAPLKYPRLAYKTPIAIGPIERGDPINFRATNPEFRTPLGTIQCSDGQLTGTLVTNGLKADEFAVTGGVSFNGGFTSGPCTSATLGDAFMEFTPGRWLGTFHTSGTSQLNGSPNLTFGLSLREGTMVCNFTATKIKSTFNTDGNPILLSTPSQKFKLDGTVANSQGCPNWSALNARWALTYNPPGSLGEYPVILTRWG